MSWAQEQRQAFIKERLLSGHTVNRSDLRAKFNISIPQASIDIQTFQRLNPDAMRYNRTVKTYERAGTHSELGRDTTAAAKSLMAADDDWLKEIAVRDPSMIRDVAAALIYERNR